MKTIDEINVNDYINFHLTDESSDFILEVYTSDGYMPIDDYDLISTNAGVLIAYKKFHEGHNGHSYVINGVRKHISSSLFDQCKSIFSNQYGDNLSFFMLLNSVKFPSHILSKKEDGSDFVRCDVNYYGGVPYYPVPEQYSLKELFNIFDIPGIGHICYFSVNEDNIKNVGTYVSNSVSRTLSGIVKVIAEWSDAYQDPFNNAEDIAYDSYLITSSSYIPEIIIQWCVNNQVDMRVSNYIKTGQTPPSDMNENTECPDIIKDFFKSQWMYSTITSIRNNHPRGLLLDQKLIDLEKDLLDREIYNICINNSVEEDDYSFLDGYFSNLNQNLKVKKLYYEYR